MKSHVYVKKGSVTGSFLIFMVRKNKIVSYCTKQNGHKKTPVKTGYSALQNESDGKSKQMTIPHTTRMYATVEARCSYKENVALAIGS